MRVGIIGCGGIAPAHIRVYKSLKGVKVVGLCDLNIEKAKNLAMKFNIKNIYSDYCDMFDKENLDLVDICTPVSTHARIVCDAAKVVPAIFLEKPMALNVNECDEIIKVINKNGCKLCIGHNQIFSPHIQRVKALIDSGSFNLHCFSTIQKESFEILKAYNLASPWNISPEQKGIIWEVCCHLAYLQLYFLPDIKEVYAVGGKVRYPVYDDFAVLLRTDAEPFGIIELSWISQETETIYELRDTAGRRIQIHWEFDYSLEKMEKPPFDVYKIMRNFLIDEKRILHKWLRFGVCYFRKRKLLPLFNLISGFIEAIKKDLPPPVSPEDGKKTVKLLECIENSLKERRPTYM